LHKLHLPRLGQTMEHGTILAWFKREGESFRVGEPLYEVESEKANLEIEAKLPGTLTRIVAREGQELPIGSLLAIVADPGESLSEAEIESAMAEESRPGIGAVTHPSPAPSSSPLPASGRISGERIRAMPRARAMAQQLGVDLATVQGSGPDGTITVEDVQRAASATPASTAGMAPRILERRPLRGIARTMAEVVTQSWREIPQFVQIVMVDASNLAARRQAEGPAVRESHSVNLSNTDLILEAVIRSVQDVPQVNASFAGDSIIVYEDINLAVAVATDEGLVVPVIHRAQGLSLGELAVQRREIVNRARSGSLSPHNVEGGTITVSNLGMAGVETGTPLVTRPQAAIVFIGAIVDRPVAVAGAVDVHPTFYISVGYDHRVVDGATAARFTGGLKRRLEAGPEALTVTS
jgi:pyruvate dehydrogenase E2 component (dihydrolipoamide acetyltransferase)